MWIATDGGVVRWDGASLTPAALPPMTGGNQALSMIGDRAGGLWVGTGRGLVRLAADGRIALDERQAERAYP